MYKKQWAYSLLILSLFTYFSSANLDLATVTKGIIATLLFVGGLVLYYLPEKK